MPDENKTPTTGEQHPLLHALMPEVDTTESQVSVHAESAPPRIKPLASFSTTPRPTERLAQMWMETYLAGYFMGTFTRDAFQRLISLLIWCLTPPARAVVRLWESTVVRQWHRLCSEFRRVRDGFTLARERIEQAGDRHRLLAVLQALVLPFMAFRRHSRLARGVLHTLMVTGSVLALVLVIRYWQNTTFALELVYGGERLGYIEDESVFKDAVDMAESRIIKNTDGYVIERESYLTLRPAQQSAVLSKAEVCDAILEMSGSDVAEMSGLYVDGVFEGALLERDDMERLLREILSLYDLEEEAANKVVEFKNKVEIVDGLYPSGSDETYQTLLERMTALDENGNSFLTVQVRCTEVYTKPIPYDKRTVKDNTKYIGYSAVRTKGVDGEMQVTADVIYINGVEQYHEILREEVIKEPVTEVTVVGSYRVNSNAQAGVATGEFLWPLPSCRIVSSSYGYRWGKLHAGVDISGNGVYGKDIIASDGGVVTQVNTSGSGGGYGLYVVVDHGNGYTTSYSHCSEILVSAGQKITQGEVIAKVGNSGNSFGPHLHFEIRVNGVPVNPEPYLN